MSAYIRHMVREWARVTDRSPRPDLGESVRLRGLGVSGVVVQRFPLVVRDGRGLEHATAPFAVVRCT